MVVILVKPVWESATSLGRVPMEVSMAVESFKGTADGGDILGKAPDRGCG